MCGIVGLVNKNGAPVELPLLTLMADRIKHRGPDDEGHLLEGPVGFYHKRLSVIDLVTGHQPMTHGPQTIVFNGEIYNYLELREQLKKQGHVFETVSDTEVILHLYADFGPECVRFLNGMYAFLIYDRAGRKIFAARDHFGIKPLYYYEDGDRLIFASEIKALLAHPGVKAEPNLPAIREYAVFQYVLGEDTFFKKIKKILPGHYAVVPFDTFELKAVKYWEPDFTVDTRHIEEYFVWTLRELLENAIDLQMRSDVPLGAHLSGGVDSSIVTLLACRKSPSPLKTFTGAFREGPEYDETPYSREVARLCGARSYEVFPNESEFIDLMPKLVYHMDEPAAGPGVFPQYMVSRLASKEVKVVLGGQGGDEIFGGYARYVVAYLEQALKGSVQETTDEGEHIVTLKSILPNLPALQAYVPLLQHFWKDGLFGPMDERYFRLIDRTGGDSSCFSGDFNAVTSGEDIFDRFQKMFNHPNTLSYYNKMVHFDMIANLPALLHVEDRVSMAVSLESRVPLLDYRIVELVAAMPPAVKFKGAEMKYILKRAVKDTLPASVLNRKDKMGFPVPLQVWAGNRAGEFFRDVLLSPACRQRGIFDIAEVERLIGREEAFGRRLWGLLNIELWFRTFIDRSGAPEA
ncbi:MAG: asparagine synthase (glutamine-hydrolyzing) [Candidatus Aminicenantales bacterium]